MVTQRVPILSHSHFFTCVVTLSSIVHLSRWALSFVQHDDDDLRQLIRLNSAALNEMSEVWKAANTAVGQVKSVAQEIYRTKKAQHENTAYWVGLSQEEVMNSIAADENIMHEVEGIQTMPNLLLE
jgi:oligoribonuclease (3'-5' exoribonuclease)